jgi:CheY-like chemotaxis protein
MYAILCIDDQAAALSALSFLVRSNGYICLSAASPEEALSAYTNSKVDMVVLDHDITCADPLALAKQLKQVRDVPLLLLCGTSLLEKPGNVDLIVHKPIEARGFSKIIQWVVRKSRSASAAS